MRHWKRPALFLALLSGAAVAQAEVRAPDYGRYGIDLAGIDHTVRPQDNISLHANGAWLKTAVIPPERSSTGIAEALFDLNEERVRKIIEDAGARRAVSDEARKIADLYSSFMDEESIARRGLAPVAPKLAAIRALASLPDVQRYIGEAHFTPVDTPLRFYVSQDAKNSQAYLTGVGQSGLVMDRDYYLDKAPAMAEVRKAYLGYLTRLFSLSGQSDPAARAKNALDFEIRIARIQWSNVDNRDLDKTYNKKTRDEAKQAVPGLDWDLLLSASGLSAADAITLDQPSYLSALAGLLNTTPVPVLQDYLAARTLDAYAPQLTQDFVAANFAFHGKALQGRTADRPRWKKAVRGVQAALGEAVGKLYVAQYFPADAKTRAEELVRNIFKAYDQSIDGLAWMSAETRRQAHAKLAKYTVKIGYPDKWRDYGGLEVKPDDLVGNTDRAAAFAYRFQIGHLGRPVDRSEWSMTPQTVNAYYNPSNNEIVFPAAILQAPYFDAKYDDAVNYGSIGATIGHEISHGFDDEGSRFDGDGNMRNWWTTADHAHFKKLTAKLVSQYSRYEPVKGKRVNGKLTLGENIADNAGLEIAYKAYRIALGGKEAPVLDGMTGDQRFFIAFAQSWRSKARKAAILQQLISDPHTPDLYRPIGTVSNLEPFYTAFDVKPGDKMYLPPSRRFHLWW
ncbi:M13 family metallopeptidase [Paludibacterium paludis]|uniref:Peptidase M13 n=1 Tax=Paludibacterium paludis TaxID=1225769 RepID=A0A918P3I3_9NEIS|nr:M13 family metallopeptidase [Paludibacterium paludis]GGY18247.1 peptidase M13 [Paludibacterium paludis]